MGTPSPCDCYQGLAAGTIDSYIGNLCTIFKSNGRGTSWNEDLHLGNPAAHHLVKDYLSTVKEQQSIARVSPRQASPLFMDKLEKRCNHLKSCILSSGDSPSLLYALIRDLAFFSIDFFSGNRASDLGSVKSMDVMISPDRSHVVFNQVVGKTLRGNGRHVFSVRRLERSSICPVANLELYLHLVRLMTIDLGSGFLFRPLDARGHITTLSFTGSTVANRLKKHMQDLSIFEGETAHGLRSGCSITLALLGVPTSEIADFIGWKSDDMVSHYTQSDRILAVQDPGSRLAAEASLGTSSIGSDFRTLNSLAGFTPIIAP
eukprot:gene6723-biopygen5497